MAEKNRGYVSPEMDVILLERGDVVCDPSRWCVSGQDGTSFGDFPIEKPCPPDTGCFFDGPGNWGGD